MASLIHGPEERLLAPGGFPDSFRSRQSRMDLLIAVLVAAYRRTFHSVALAWAFFCPRQHSEAPCDRKSPSCHDLYKAVRGPPHGEPLECWLMEPRARLSVAVSLFCSHEPLHRADVDDHRIILHRSIRVALRVLNRTEALGNEGAAESTTQSTPACAREEKSHQRGEW